MVSCVFPGSFDPMTKGHLDLIQRAASIFDRVTVTVMINVQKKGTIPVNKRIDMLRKACSPFRNVVVDQWNGLLADYMMQKDETVVLRGLRNCTELEHETQSFYANKRICSRIETIFIPCDSSLSGVSSSAVREIAQFGGDIRAFVPDMLTEEIASLLSKRDNKCK